jgi:DNA-binding NtrC family response regulator
LPTKTCCCRRWWQKLGHENADVLLLSRAVVGEPREQTIAQLRELPDSPMVVVVDEDGGVEEQARWLAVGCEAVIDARLSRRRLKAVLSAILSRRLSTAEATVAAGRQAVEPRLADLASSSPAMQTFMRVVERVVPNDVPLLILGETGVGKERLARAVHAESPRSVGPFIAVNCGALPETLLESELFGHGEGAFTGATRSRRGWFELAHRG